MSDPASPRVEGPLAGLRVVEFSQNAAVPQCGRLLAGMGADVVKVEPLGGDSMRYLARLTPSESRAYATINPGKRAIAIDLAAAGADNVVDALIGWADVCLVGLKAGDVQRFGLDWERVHARNPRVVQLALTAFGPLGPDADQGGYDVLVQAISGLGFSMNRTKDGTPLPTRPAFIDFAAGAIATTGVLAALRMRDQSGVGQRVDTSLLGAAMTLGTPILSSFARDEEAMAAVRDEQQLLRESGADFDTQRAVYESTVVAGAGVFHLYFRHYRTADGLLSVAGMSPALIGRFHEITGLQVPHTHDPTDLEFQTVVEQAEALFVGRTTEEWLHDLRAGGYPCGPYNLPYEAVEDPQVVANDYVVDLEHPVFGGYRTVGMPFRLSNSRTEVTAPSPQLGEHSRQVLAEVGLDDATIDALIAQGILEQG